MIINANEPRPEMIDQKKEELKIQYKRMLPCPECVEESNSDKSVKKKQRNMVASHAMSVCGERGSGSGPKTRTKSLSAKQEVNSKFGQMLAESRRFR
ncbi:MAG: hypothetical protein FWG02_11505 [Holophagaceae bacterium]|nr:hypothetical protein [Holophagaceae bacterium]